MSCHIERHDGNNNIEFSKRARFHHAIRTVGEGITRIFGSTHTDELDAREIANKGLDGKIRVSVFLREGESYEKYDYETNRYKAIIHGKNDGCIH